jgi:hypothetical protein
MTASIDLVSLANNHQDDIRIGEILRHDGEESFEEISLAGKSHTP